MFKKNRILPIIVIIISIILTSCAAPKRNGQSEFNFLQLVNTEKLTTMLKTNKDMVIVDLREPDLFADSRVPGSINIPFDDIETRYKELPKNKKIVFVCHTGRMGTESGNLLLQNGYKQVFNLEGGMAKWTGELEK